MSATAVKIMSQNISQFQFLPFHILIYTCNKSICCIVSRRGNFNMTFSVIFFVVLCLVITRVFLNWLKLSSIPGPFFAGLSDSWRAYYQYRGKLRSELLRLHKKNGPVVRYGVNSVSFSDPSAISVIYGSRAGYITVGIMIWFEIGC